MTHERPTRTGARSAAANGRHALALTLAAFALHFAWENVQCPLFFVHGSYDASALGMLVASLVDVGLTWAIYAAVALVSGQWRWARTPWTWEQWLTLLVAAFVLGVVVEQEGLATGRWAYREAMPLVPELGVGVVPLVQLLLLPALSFAIAERVCAGRRRARAEETATTRARYDRIAPVYDLMEWWMELFWLRRWRRELWSRVGAAEALLELGVGTGKNLPFHPAGGRVTAVELSERMLARARGRARRLGRDVALRVADVQELPFADASFDTVVATFLFCSVPDPVRGLAEARRVLRPGGRLLLLEHVLSERPLVRRLMRWLDPVPLHVWGAHIDRDTVGNVRRAGFEDVRVARLALDVVVRIEARRGA